MLIDHHATYQDAAGTNWKVRATLTQCGEVLLETHRIETKRVSFEELQKYATIRPFTPLEGVADEDS